MAARRATKLDSQPESKTSNAPPGEWGAWIRVLVSVVLVWHVTVIFLSPLSVPPSSPLVFEIAQSSYVRWYTDTLYLNHGYGFFGPEPPMGGTIIKYAVEADDGRVIAEDEFPNLQQQWPRLWYHRHMMLADQMASVGVYGDPQRDRELMLRSYARHLLRKHKGARARVENQWHRSLRPDEVRNDVDPYDLDNYVRVEDDPRRRNRNTWTARDQERFDQMQQDPDLALLYDEVMQVVETRATLDQPLLPKSPPEERNPEELPIGVGG